MVTDWTAVSQSNAPSSLAGLREAESNDRYQITTFEVFPLWSKAVHLGGVLCDSPAEQPAWHYVETAQAEGLSVAVVEGVAVVQV